MAEVMLGEQKLVHLAEFVVDRAQFLEQQIFLKQLFAQPHRHGGAERLKAARGEGEIGFEQPLEFEERLVIEGDAVDLARANAGVGDAPTDGVDGKPGSCFLRVKRSSCAALTMTPSRTIAAALSW